MLPDPRAVARALDGEIAGANRILAPGPGHSRRDRSLSVKIDLAAREGFLVHSFAGDDPIWCRDHVRQRLGLPFCQPREDRRRPEQPRALKRPTLAVAENDREAQRRFDLAMRLWAEAGDPRRTIAERYLRSRSLKLPPPPSLRFHGGLKHPSGGIWPAMIALVTRGPDNVPLAVHRTFLDRDGGGKALVDPQKMVLGPCRGGAVRFAAAGDLLMVGEGIETCLAAMQATSHPVWAALSTSGLRALDLPTDVRNVIVLADGDNAGEAAALNAAMRWKREGRRVRVARPPQGSDFNDMLVGRASHVEEGTS